jgi:diacylglycerol kinase family enzyme
MNQNIKHLFIINPRSFWKKSYQNQIVVGIHQFFRDINNSEYDLHVSQFPRDAVGFIPLFAKSLPDSTTLRVYAVGGDGILFDCLNGIMGLKNVELAAIPYGYTNNFIRGFDKNDRSLFRVMSQQYDAPTIPMDVMRCGNNYALNYCVVGLEAGTVLRTGKIRERLEKGHSLNRWLSRQFYTRFFYEGCLGACSDKKLLHQRYEVDIDGEKSIGAYQGISIFNSPYYGGNMHPINNAMPNDGMLDILTIRSQGVFRIFCLFPFYVSGHYKMFPRNFTLKEGKKISIRSENILLVSMDGIVFFEPELEIELLPAAVQFVDAGRHGYKGWRS